MILLLLTLVWGTIAEEDYQPCLGKDGCELPLREAGDGNCNSDEDCGGLLICGQHNCQRDFPDRADWSSEDSCCVDPGSISKEYSYPRADMAMYMMNMKFDYDHLDIEGAKLNPNAGDPSVKSLWMLNEKSKGQYFLYHPNTESYLECMPNTQRLKVRAKDDDRNDAQLWTFEESRKNKGFYYIFNVLYPTYRITMLEKGKMACYDGGDVTEEFTESQSYAKLSHGSDCYGDFTHLDNADSVEDCANKVRDAIKNGDDYAFLKPFFQYGYGSKTGWCFWSRSMGCPEGFQDDIYDYYALVDDSTYYMNQHPQYDVPEAHAELPRRENECDWNGDDKPGRWSLGGGDHWTIECNEKCLNSADDKPCTFASMSDEDHYCHYTQTCSNAGKEVNWQGEWHVWERTSVKGRFIDQLWHLVDIYDSNAIWKVVLRFTCQHDVCNDIDFTEVVGTSQTFSESMGMTKGIEKSMERSAGLEIKALNLGASHETTISKQFTSSIANARSETYQSERHFGYDMVRDECVELRQINIDQDDSIGKVTVNTGMEWYLESSCGDCDWYSGDGDTEGATRNNVATQTSKADCIKAVREWNTAHTDKPANGAAWYDTTGECVAIQDYSGRGGHQIGWPGVDQWFTCAVKDEEDKSLPPMRYSTDKDGHSSTAGASTGGTSVQGAPMHGPSTAAHSTSSTSSSSVSSPDHTLDQEYHMKEADTDVEYSKEESWTRKEMRRKREAMAMAQAAAAEEGSHGLVVQFFALVGLGFVAYGAVKYYVVNKGDAYNSLA